MDTKLLPAFMCNIASRVVWLRQAIEQDPELKKVAHKLARFTAPMSFEKELLSGKMDQVQKVVDEISTPPILEEDIESRVDDEWLSEIASQWMYHTGGALWDTCDGETREEGLRANITALFSKLTGK